MAQKAIIGETGKLNFSENNAKDINAIVDTPKGSRSKFKYDEATGLYILKNVLPDGMTFPFNFGYLPSTLGEDGDPLDVLILMDQPVFPGCMVEIRLVGAIEAEQSEDGRTFRNDRLLAVAIQSPDFAQIQTLKQLPDDLLNEIERFFVTYEEQIGRQVKVLGRFGRFRAIQLVNTGLSRRKKAKNKK